MKVFVESTHGEMNFKGTNERGQSMQFSGNKEAVSPMESVLMGHPERMMPFCVPNVVVLNPRVVRDVSMEQYCSVSIMLAKSVEITHSVEVRIPEWNDTI